jgi:ABC-type nickel/cobalt efflux system permease component RcnA
MTTENGRQSGKAGLAKRTRDRLRKISGPGPQRAALALLVVAIAVLIWLTRLTASGGSLVLEAAKVCMQVIGVVIVGGFVTYLYNTMKSDADRAHQKRDNDFERAHAAKLRENEVLQTMRADMVHAYNGVKLVRRRLKALSGRGKIAIELDDYDEAMSKLCDYQLQFESLKRQAKVLEKVRPQVQTQSGTPLSDIFQSIEKKLGAVWSKYEENRAKLQTGEPYSLSKDRVVSDFISGRELNVEGGVPDLVNEATERLIEMIVSKEQEVEHHERAGEAAESADDAPAASTD